LLDVLVVSAYNHSIANEIGNEMNERIEKLWEQAAKTTQGDSWEEQTKFMERYTELIVRECVDVIQKEVSFKYKDGGETEEFMGGHYAGSLLARVKIKRHFGVEE
jgi:leucyl aminopeptidase (aminopeptidase T)